MVDGEIKTKFEDTLHDLRHTLLWVSIYFNHGMNLWPTPERVKVINRYRGFFIPASKALWNQFTISMTEIFSTHNNAPSIYKALRIIENNPELIPEINTKDYRKTLRKHNKTIDSIKKHRNKLAVHHDVKWGRDNRPEIGIQRSKQLRIEYGKTRDLLKDCQEIYNNISSAYSRDIWAFDIPQHEHSNYILNELEEYHNL